MRTPIERIRASAAAALECLKSARTERDARRYIQQVLDGIDVAVSLGEFSTERTQAPDTIVKHMVNRFLGWRLPEDFSPDAGISFKPTFNDHLPTPTRHEPTGTNLFCATQAEAMVRYMLDGLPEATLTSENALLKERVKVLEGTKP